MAKKNQAAVEMAKLRSSSLSPARRRSIALDASEMRWAPRTKQDQRIGRRIKERLEAAILEAVDTLFDCLKKDGKLRALVIHQGTAWVADTATLDYRVFAQKHPTAIVGVYDRNASRQQVLDDLSEMDACASILKMAV